VDIQLQAFLVRQNGGSWEINAAAGTEGGWRALKWSDLSKDVLGGQAAPTLPEKLRDNKEVTVDEVLAEMQQLPDGNFAVAVRMKVVPPGRGFDNARRMLERIDEEVAPRSMKRIARKLIVPSVVRLSWWTRSGKAVMPDLYPTAENEYYFDFGAIVETTHF